MLTHNKTPYPTLRGRVDFSRIWITDVWNSRYATACHFKTYSFIPDELLLETFFIRIHRGALHSSIINGIKRSRARSDKATPLNYSRDRATGTFIKIS